MFTVGFQCMHQPIKLQQVVTNEIERVGGSRASRIHLCSDLAWQETLSNAFKSEEPTPVEWEPAPIPFFLQ